MSVRTFDVPVDCDPFVDRGTFGWDDNAGVYGTVRLDTLRYVISDGDHVEVGCEHIVLRLTAPDSGPSDDDARRLTDWWDAVIAAEASLRTDAWR